MILFIAKRLPSQCLVSTCNFVAVSNFSENVAFSNIYIICVWLADFLREKQGRVWRFSDWGMRSLAYKIKKATHAHYILMNFELRAQSINEFKSMLDKDERVIRHLVMKRDKAITEECPPPPELNTLEDDTDDEYEVDDMDYDDGEDEEWYDDDEGDLEGYEDDEGDLEGYEDDEEDLEGYEDDEDVESELFDDEDVEREQFSSANVVTETGNLKRNRNDKSKKDQKREKVLR